MQLRQPYLILPLFFGGCALGALTFVLWSSRGDAVIISPHGTYDASLYMTKEDIADTPAVLAERKQEQQKALEPFTALHGFSFEDRQPFSGITFLSRIVPILPVTSPYDHLGAVAAADVDGDGLVDLYFTSPLGKNGLWKNLGSGVFKDISRSSGTDDALGVSAGIAFADMDNDGDADLLVSTIRAGLRFFENDGTGHFRDISKAAGFGGLADRSLSGVVVFDYNNDGLLDVLITSIGKFTTDKKYSSFDVYVPIKDPVLWYRDPARAEPTYLFKNEGKGKFRDVAGEVGMQSVPWSGDASFSDLNGDRFPDLYLLSMDGDDHYVENEQGKRFSDLTQKRFGETPWGSMGIKFFDYNNDGRMDLYITDMHSDMTPPAPPSTLAEKQKTKTHTSHADETQHNIHGNALYRNEGETFREVSGATGAETFWPWGPSVGDLNADGFQDVFVSSGMGALFWYATNPVLLNDRGSMFRNAEFVLGVEPRRGGAYLTPEPAITGYGEVPAVRSTRSSVILDLDTDGDLDIVTNDADGHPQLLISDLAARRRISYVSVQLRGQASNREGLGATVYVTAGGKRYMQYHDGKSGYLAQSGSMPLYFGLGDAQRVEKIEVRWPSGVTTELTDAIPLNRTILVAEAGELAR